MARKRNFYSKRYELINLDYRTGLYDKKTKKRVDELLSPEIREHGGYNPSLPMAKFRAKKMKAQNPKEKWRGVTAKYWMK